MSARRRILPGAAVLVLAAILVAAGHHPARAAAPAATTATLLAVGDIGWCGGTDDEAVAALVARTPGSVLLLGDIAYQDGSTDALNRCFLPAWSGVVPRARVALGNHDIITDRGAPTRAVFSSTGPTWFAVDIGAWRVIVLDSNCWAVGGCGAGSPQWTWLRDELRRSPHRCTLAAWHHPRFSSGLHGSNTMTQPLWALLARARAELVLSGHDHDYERFAPRNGIRQVVVGTGGAPAYPLRTPREVGSLVGASGSYGALRLTLRPKGWSWSFLTASGPTVTDAGSARCA